MEQIDKETGKKIAYTYYKVGDWYKFPAGNRTKYMKVEKIKDESNGCRCFLYGTGFEVLHDALITPKTTKFEPIVFCWAKDYTSQHIFMLEEEVKEIYKKAAEKAYNNLFNNKLN